MRVLLVGSFKYPMYAPAFSSGFKALGHEVIEIDYEQYHLKYDNFASRFHNRFQDRFLLGFMIRKYNKDIIETVEKAKPDFVFFYRCYHVWPITLEKIKGQLMLMSYNNDDPFGGVPSKNYFRYHLACARYCDINFVYRKKNIDDYASKGIYNAQVLLPYFIEKNNYFESIQDDIPIAFAGHFEDDGRDGYIKALIDSQLSVTVFNGSYWERAPLYDEIKSVIQPGVKTIEYNHVLNRCQIALVFLSKLNHDTYTRRCFEIPATKTLMLCEYTDDLNMMFPADECAVYFKTKEELVEKSRYLLSHPNEIKRIALNGYHRLKEIGGSEIDRCKQVIEKYNKAIKQ